MTTILPVDQNNHMIPAMRLRKNGAHSITADDTSVTNEIPFAATTRIVSLYATDDVFIEFGGEDVEADEDSHFFPGGVYYDVAIGGGNVAHCTHVAALGVNGECILYISEKA